MDELLTLIHQKYDNMQDFYDESGLTSAELLDILQLGADGVDEIGCFQLCHTLRISMDKFSIGIIEPEEMTKNIETVVLEDVIGELIFRLHDHPVTLGGSRIHPDVLDAFQYDLEQALIVARRRQKGNDCLD